METGNTFCDKFAIHASRLWLAGLAPKAPGTAGSAVAAILAPFILMPLPIWLRIVLVAAIFFVGSHLITRAEKALGSHDPGEIVLDELVGQWVTFIPFTMVSPWWIVVGFFVFRFFDITKPFPVRDSEKWFDGGWSVMIDDVIAGFYAMASLGVLMWFFG